ncbi:hypothetical protein GW835_01685 [archaeon]|nr:hypothetical protein [archaeon]NCP79260.1 hypothetical protein [archaeon]NCP97792.1 hypothetical protein [archaeon]NCQ07027.1 hypothetical protein [archaeon]NCQ50823.1 hypothetical protein [archaeon]
MEYIISILGLIVAILGILLSFYIESKNKPKLYVEKEVLEVKMDENEIWIYFYLSNVGQRPTTIKKMELYHNKTKFMPNSVYLNVSESVSLGVGLKTSYPLPSYKPVIFPFLLQPNHTDKILVKLNYSSKENFEKEMNLENNLKYKIIINYSNKKKIFDFK